MKGFVFVGIVGFLKNGDVVGTALVEISIFIRIYRINFQADDAEIFPGDLTGISNVFDSGFGTAFSGKNQDFLKAGGGDGCHFFFDFIRGKLCPADFVVAVETAVNTVVFTVVCNVNGCEHVNTVAEMFPGFCLGCLSDFFQERKGGRREQCLKIFHGAVLMSQRALDVCGGKCVIIVGLHGRDDLV